MLYADYINRLKTVMTFHFMNLLSCMRPLRSQIFFEMCGNFNMLKSTNTRIIMVEHFFELKNTIFIRAFL